jgi:hypothetical protein
LWMICCMADLPNGRLLYNKPGAPRMVDSLADSA